MIDEIDSPEHVFQSGTDLDRYWQPLIETVSPPAPTGIELSYRALCGAVSTPIVLLAQGSIALVRMLWPYWKD